MRIFIKNVLGYLDRKLYIAFLVMFFVGQVVPAARISAAGAAALEKEREKQAMRDEIDTRSIQEVQGLTKPNKFTQTEAHLSLPSVRDLLVKSYNITKYANIVTAVEANEARHPNHYAFYHGTDNVYRLPQNLYSQLYNYANPQKKAPENFTFLRFKGEHAEQNTAKDFLIKELESNGLIDDNGALGAVLLSVNLSLFGNVGFLGECTWQYFMHPESHKVPKREDYVEMLKSFGFNDKYVDELMALVPIYETKEQTLLQILVPKEKVDEIGYLAWVKGIPAHAETMKWVLDNVKHKRYELIRPKMEELTENFKQAKEKNPMFKDMMESVKAGDYSLDAFLKVYCNKPWEVKGINDVTARLIFTPDVLLNPESGVKFYRYSTTSREKLKEYHHKLNTIVDKMIADEGAGLPESGSESTKDYDDLFSPAKE